MQAKANNVGGFVETEEGTKTELEFLNAPRSEKLPEINVNCTRAIESDRTRLHRVVEQQTALAEEMQFIICNKLVIQYHVT